MDRNAHERIREIGTMATYINDIVESLVYLGIDAETIAELIKEELRCLTKQQ